MKVKRSETPDGKIELQITAPVNKVQEAIKFIDFQLAIQNGVDIRSVENLTEAVKEKVGEAYYKSFMDFQIMIFLAPFAVSQEKIAIIGPPRVESMGKSVELGREFSFRAIVIPKPIYEMTDFSPVKIQIPRASVSEAEIDEQMLKIAESYITYEKEENRPLRDGDDLLFAMKTVDSLGKEIPNLTAERRAYTIGQNYLPGGFDEQLIGMEVGQTKTFDITAKEFSRNFAEGSEETETYTFTITLEEIQRRIIPAITDTWVKKNIPGCSTVPELREEVRKQGLEFKEREFAGMKSFAAASEFAKRFKGSIPDELYELTREEIISNLQQNLKAQGKTLQEVIKEQPGGEQQFSMELMLQTREVLIQSFTLDALARHLKLEITDADINETFHAMAPNYEQQARMEFEMTGRMYQIEEAALRNKANKWLVETAEIEYL